MNLQHFNQIYDMITRLSIRKSAINSIGDDDVKFQKDYTYHHKKLRGFERKNRT